MGPRPVDALFEFVVGQSHWRGQGLRKVNRGNFGCTIGKAVSRRSGSASGLSSGRKRRSPKGIWWTGTGVPSH